MKEILDGIKADGFSNKQFNALNDDEIIVLTHLLGLATGKLPIKRVATIMQASVYTITKIRNSAYEKLAALDQKLNVTNYSIDAIIRNILESFDINQKAPLALLQDKLLEDLQDNRKVTSIMEAYRYLLYLKQNQVKQR